MLLYFSGRGRGREGVNVSLKCSFYTHMYIRTYIYTHSNTYIPS